jgi:polyhydroxyalkanoate synthesis regulator phasin
MSLRNKKKAIATAGASLALVATMMGVGLASTSADVFAAPAAPGIEHLMQTTGTPGTQPGQPGQQPGRRGPGQGRPNMQQHQQMEQAYQNALAGRLGITADQLQAAMKQARIDVINQAVQAGQITQDQANQRIQAIQSGQRMGPQNGQGPRGQGQPGQGRPGFGQRGPGMRGGGELASILGMSPDELRTAFQSGKSLAQIGQEKGISRDDLKAKILAARKTRLDQAVQAGKMTAEQEQQILDRMTANIDRQLDMTPGQRGPRQ